jgi:hypothetical protein
MKGLLLSVVMIVFLAWAATLNWSCQSNPPSSTTFPQAITFLTFPTPTPCGYPGATCTPTPTPPPLCQATPISLGTTVVGNTTFGTDDYISTCGGSGNDDTYIFTLGSTRTVTISTCSINTNFDTVIDILSSCNPVTQIGCNDQDSSCSASGNFSTIVGTLPAGTYWIVVDGWGGASGQYQLVFK